MKPVNFDYVRASDADDALRQLKDAPDNAKLLAGGQSLGPLLNLRLVQPTLLIDIRTCPDLRQVNSEPDATVYGAALTHAEFEDGLINDVTEGCLRSAARHIAYRAVRNRGTLGGSLVHADPAADWPTIMLALGAEAVIKGQNGLRALSMSNFSQGAFDTNLASDELLFAVRVPKPSSVARWGYYKFCIKAGEFAKASAAVLHDPERSVTQAVIGALDRPPLLLENTDELLKHPATAEALLKDQLPELTGAKLRLHTTALKRAVLQLDQPRGVS